MRITRIHLDGPTGAHAEMTREGKEPFIKVILMTSGGTRHHSVQRDDRGGIWSMAEILYEALEGRPGRDSQVHEYDKVLRQLSDL